MAKGSNSEVEGRTRGCFFHDFVACSPGISIVALPVTTGKGVIALSTLRFFALCMVLSAALKIRSLPSSSW